jgi:hypothetical protein
MQTSGYPEQEFRREQEFRGREYTPQQPGPAYTPQQAPGAPAPGGAAPAAPEAAGPGRAGGRGLTDWVRWGPIWAGFLTVISVLAILGALGTAIGLTVWGAGSNTAFNYGWAILIGIIAYFLGGWLAARSAGVAGLGAAALNGGLVWALSLLAVLVLVVVGASSAVGAIGGNLGSALGTTRGATGTAASAAWISFVTFVIGLCLAMLGGLVGARRMPTLGARQRVR